MKCYTAIETAAAATVENCVETEILRNWSRCVCDAATELGLDRGKWNAISLLSAFIPLSSPL
jgi:hypothetical protein